MRRINFIGILATAFVLTSFGLLTSGAMAQDVYPAKDITFICHAQTGGGFDIFARMVSPYLSKAIKEVSPGAKGGNIKVENMSGAAGAKSCTHMYKEADPDGYTIATFNSGDIFKFTMGPQKLPFDPIGLTWLFSIAGSPRVLISNKKGLASWEEMLAKSKKETVMFASVTVGSAAHMEAIFFVEEMGLNGKIACAGGTSQATAAIIRGDGDVALLNYDSVRTLIEAKEVNCLVTFTEKRILAQVPTIAEKGRPDLLEVIGESVGRICMAPPKLDPGAKRILLAAARKMIADPEFQAHYSKMVYGEIIPTFDKDLEQKMINIKKFYLKQAPNLKKHGLLKD